MRDRDPETLDLVENAQAFDGTWTDYDGDTVYGDYTLSVESTALTATRTADHMPGIYQATTQPAETNWYHSDQVGTTRAMSGANAAVTRRAIYTAFGELVDETGSVGTRYGYCGAFGYEGGGGTWGGSGNDDGLLHVGWRFYDPATGRFLQRDPIGIRGGLNLYAYVNSSPLTRIDPRGKSMINIHSPPPEPVSDPADGGTGAGGTNDGLISSLLRRMFPPPPINPPPVEVPPAPPINPRDFPSTSQPTNPPLDCSTISPGEGMDEHLRKERDRMNDRSKQNPPPIP